VIGLRGLVLLGSLLPESVALLAGSADAQATATVTVSTVQSSETNLSILTSQSLGSSTVSDLLLFDSAFSEFGARNSDSVIQGPSSFTPIGQFVSPQSFPFGSRAVAVNSNLAAVGSLAASGLASTNYFAFNEAAGADINLFAIATHPSSQGAELLLYDINSNLVAIANGNGADGLSSMIDYTVPSGGGGTWFAAVTHTEASAIGYRFALALPLQGVSEFTTNVVGNGTMEGGSLGRYDVNALVGDNLSFEVHSTSPAELHTELLLYDNTNNLVAVAQGDGPDGLSSRIDFTVPSGEAGEWQIDVVPISGAYHYDLAIQGASGSGPINPTPAPVPEFSTWAMLMFGFAGLGLAGYRTSCRAVSSCA
jgi:hypothetical protein